MKKYYDVIMLAPPLDAYHLSQIQKLSFLYDDILVINQQNVLHHNIPLSPFNQRQQIMNRRSIKAKIMTETLKIEGKAWSKQEYHQKLSALIKLKCKERVQIFTSNAKIQIKCAHKIRIQQERKNQSIIDQQNLNIQDQYTEIQCQMIFFLKQKSAEQKRFAFEEYISKTIPHCIRVSSLFEISVFFQMYPSVHIGPLLYFKGQITKNELLMQIMSEYSIANNQYANSMSLEQLIFAQTQNVYKVGLNQQIPDRLVSLHLKKFNYSKWMLTPSKIKTKSVTYTLPNSIVSQFFQSGNVQNTILHLYFEQSEEDQSSNALVAIEFCGEQKYKAILSSLLMLMKVGISQECAEEWINSLSNYEQESIGSLQLRQTYEMAPRL